MGDRRGLFRFKSRVPCRTPEQAQFLAAGFAEGAQGIYLVADHQLEQFAETFVRRQIGVDDSRHLLGTSMIRGDDSKRILLMIV
jgi:hypothetical protein